MTRADVIAKMFQPPVRNWIIENVLEQRPTEWLETENENFGNWGGVLKAFSVLDMSFSWADSKEGDEFWREIYNKLRDERR